MAIRLLKNVQAKQLFRRVLSAAPAATSVPNGHFAIYVGETHKKRFVVPIAYLSHPAFQDLLNQAEEEFGFDHPMGGLTIPCREETFVHLITSRLQMC